MGSGFKTFTAAEVLTAADLNNFCQSQSVMSFASSTARDAAITSPAEGMVAVLRDEDVTTIYSGTAWVRFVQYGAGSTYTPTLTGSTTNPTQGTTGFPEAFGAYSQNGNIVTGHARFAAGSTGAAIGSGNYQFLLPVSCKIGGTFTTRGTVIGSGYYTDASAATANYVCTVIATNATFAILKTVAGTIGSTLPGWANNDIIQIHFTYEAA